MNVSTPRPIDANELPAVMKLKKDGLINRTTYSNINKTIINNTVQKTKRKDANDTASKLSNKSF